MSYDSDLLAPALLAQLARLRLVGPRDRAWFGTGERRSRDKGPGIEFEDHRHYEPGDDTRYLDLHAYTRTGQYYIRRHTLYRQLPITLLLDGTTSMGQGTPGKFVAARALTAGLAYVALAGGDTVRVGVVGEHLVLHPALSGLARAPQLLRWLRSFRPAGAPQKAECFIRSLEGRSGEGLLIILSDWYLDGHAELLSAARAAGQTVIAIHVVAPDEEEPALLGTGALTLHDAETGDQVELVLTPDLLEQYRAHFQNWCRELDGSFAAATARCLRVRSDEDPAWVLLRSWREQGLLA